MQYGARMLLCSRHRMRGFDTSEEYIKHKKPEIFNFIKDELVHRHINNVETIDDKDGDVLLEIRLEIVTASAFREFVKLVRELDLRREEIDAIMGLIKKTFGNSANQEDNHESIH